MDIPSLVEHAFTALVSGGGTGAGSFMFYRARIKSLEDKLKKHLEADYPKFVELTSTLEARVERRVREAVLSTLQRHFNALHTRLEGRWRQQQEAIQFLREGRGDFVKKEEFDAFSASQEEEWRKIQRSLGQIEGLLKALTGK